MSLELEERKSKQLPRGAMWANVFHSTRRFGLEEKVIPQPGPGEAVIQVRLTTLCQTDLQIVNGKRAAAEGLTLGHEAAGVVHALGAGVSGYRIGQRVLVGATTPCGQCEACLAGVHAQCTGAPGGGRLGQTIDGVQAQYALIPHAQANLALIPEELGDEQVLLLADTASTGFAAAERAKIRLGDDVAVFGQGPVGLCATLGARLQGASEIAAVDSDARRLKMAQRFGATSVILAEGDPLAEIREVTEGRGADVAIEALGIQETFEKALRSLRPGGTLSSVGVYTSPLQLPMDAFGSGVADYTIVTTRCPGGKERMARLMRLIRTHRIDLTPLFTHVFPLEEIDRAYQLFESRKDGVLKVAVRIS